MLNTGFKNLILFEKQNLFTQMGTQFLCRNSYKIIFQVWEDKKLMIVITSREISQESLVEEIFNKDKTDSQILCLFWFRNESIKFIHVQTKVS